MLLGLVSSGSSSATSHALILGLSEGRGQSWSDSRRQAAQSGAAGGGSRAQARAVLMGDRDGDGPGKPAPSSVVTPTWQSSLPCQTLSRYNAGNWFSPLKVILPVPRSKQDLAGPSAVPTGPRGCPCAWHHCSHTDVPSLCISHQPSVTHAAQASWRQLFRSLWGHTPHAAHSLGPAVGTPASHPCPLLTRGPGLHYFSAIKSLKWNY